MQTLRKMIIMMNRNRRSLDMLPLNFTTVISIFFRARQMRVYAKFRNQASAGVISRKTEIYPIRRLLLTVFVH